jgi:hypothetical protein
MRSVKQLFYYQFETDRIVLTIQNQRNHFLNQQSKQTIRFIKPIFDTNPTHTQTTMLIQTYRIVLNQTKQN